MRLCALLIVVALMLNIGACSSSGGGDSSARGVVSSSAMVGAAGGTVGSNANAYIVIPPGALDQDTMISIGSGSNIALPGGFDITGPAVEASPDGLTFNTAATIAIPVDPNLVPDGFSLDQLVVYKREGDGTILPATVTGIDPDNSLIFVATDGFTTFQTAVASGTFAITPRTSFLKTENIFFSETLTVLNGFGGITFVLVSSMKTHGSTTADATLATGEIAPGIAISSAGTISGSPTERGTWAFSVTATDSTTPTAQTSTISLTLTVDGLVNTTFTGSAFANGMLFTYDDAGDLFAVGVNQSAITLSKIAAGSTTVTSVAVGNGSNPAFAVAPDGTAVVVVFEQVQNANPLTSQIKAVEFDGSLMVTTAEARVDIDPVVATPADVTLDASVRQAIRPGVAFAIDRNVTPPATPPLFPAPKLYLVGYEQIRNKTSATGELRSDTYAVWRAIGSGTITDELRLDTTSTAGQTTGDGVVVAGIAAGCMVLWTDQGGNNANTNGNDASGNPILGSPGEVMMSNVTVPAFAPDGTGVLPTTPIMATPPTPMALNAEATTSGLHAGITVSSTNKIYAVWTERDDTPTPAGTPTATTLRNGRSSQTNAILFRRPTTLKVADITGGTAATTFSVDDSPVSASVFAGAVAVDSMGDIAVAWAEAFTDGTTLDGTFLKRFTSAGTPIDNSIEMGVVASPILAFNMSDALSFGFKSGGTIQTFTLDPPAVP